MSTGPVSDEAGEKFLERDFVQCFTQMRHYDQQILDIVKFTFTTYTAILGVAVALYQFSKKEQVNLIPATTAIEFVGFVFGVVMMLFVVRNRVYFVFVARSINEHRRLFLRGKPLGFENTAGLYTSPAHPDFFNWGSSQSVLLYALSLLNSIMLGAICFPYMRIRYSLCLGVASLVAHVAPTVVYLKTRDRKTADKAVFGVEGKSDLTLT